jgi:hypothetical protein
LNCSPYSSSRAALERAAFASVLHQQFVPGSDRCCEKWMSDYRIEGITEL